MATDVVLKTDTEAESDTVRSSPAQSTNDSDGAATDPLLQTNGNSSEGARGDEEGEGGTSSGTESLVNSTALTSNDSETPVNGVSPSAATAQSPGAAPGLEPLVSGHAASPGVAPALSGGSSRPAVAAVAVSAAETGEPSSKRLCLDVSSPTASTASGTTTGTATATPPADVTGQRAFELIESSLLKLKREVRALDLLVRQKEREWDSLLKLRKVKEETFQRLRRKRKVLLLQSSDVAAPTIAPSLSVTPVPMSSAAEVSSTRRTGAPLAPRKAPSLSSLPSSVSASALAAVAALPSYTQSMALRKPPLSAHPALPLQPPPGPLQPPPGSLQPPSSVVAVAAAAAANDARFRDALAQIIKLNKPAPELSVHQVPRPTAGDPLPPSSGQQLPASVSPVSQQQQQQSSLAKLLIESKRKQNDAVLSEILKHPQMSLVSPMGRSAAAAAAAPLAQPAVRVSSTASAAPTPGAEAVPVCQGCRLRQAQFVCAGCGNQWYCSRECQVASWDSHAEECTE